MADQSKVDAMRRRMVQPSPSYTTMVGKSLLEDHMKAHYAVVKNCSTKVDANKPGKAHYQILQRQKDNPKFKPTLFDQYLRNKHDKEFFTAMKNAKSMTDSSAPEHALLYSRNRRNYRQKVSLSKTYQRSAGHEIQWSKTEELVALGFLGKHTRAVSLSKGWTDSGPPEKAMQYREFRRSFKKPAVLDIAPPKNFHASQSLTQSRCSSRNRLTSQPATPVQLQPLAAQRAASQPLEATELPSRRSSTRGITPLNNNSPPSLDPVGKTGKVPKTAAQGQWAGGGGAAQLFSRSANTPVETKRVWMPASQSLGYKEIAVHAGKGQAGGLVGHKQRGAHSPEHPPITPRSPSTYPLPKAETQPKSPLLTPTGSRVGLDSREGLPARRETTSRKQMIHPRRAPSPEAPRSRQTTPTTFDLQVSSNLDAECTNQLPGLTELEGENDIIPSSGESEGYESADDFEDEGEQGEQ